MDMSAKPPKVEKHHPSDRSRAGRDENVSDRIAVLDGWRESTLFL